MKVNSPAELFYILYFILDMIITFIGFYLFYSLLKHKLPLRKVKKNQVMPSPSTDHSPGSSVPVLPMDENFQMQVLLILKWNFIGVLLCQLPTSAMAILSAFLQGNVSFLLFRRDLMKPLSTLCNVLGICLMFCDHHYMCKRMQSFQASFER